jgi:hypothetical protein
VKKPIVALLLSALLAPANAAPGTSVVNACLRTESAPPKVRYTPIEATGFEVTEVVEDGEVDKIVTTVHLERDAVGTWQRKKPLTFGLVFNGKEIPSSRVVRLKKDQSPEAFDPYEAVWGVAHDGKKSYICATFNFDGLGKSGSFQNVRGLYLIERNKRGRSTFYTAGKISVSNE